MPVLYKAGIVRHSSERTHRSKQPAQQRGDKKISCSTRAPLPLKKEAAAESNQELLGGDAPF